MPTNERPRFDRPATDDDREHFPFEEPIDKFEDLICNGYTLKEALESTKATWQWLFGRSLTDAEKYAIDETFASHIAND